MFKQDLFSESACVFNCDVVDSNYWLLGYLILEWKNKECLINFEEQEYFDLIM